MSTISTDNARKEIVSRVTTLQSINHGVAVSKETYDVVDRMLNLLEQGRARIFSPRLYDTPNGCWTVVEINPADGSPITDENKKVLASMIKPGQPFETELMDIYFAFKKKQTIHSIHKMLEGTSMQLNF